MKPKTAAAVAAYLAGQTVAQIAAASGVSTVAVYTKLRRAGVSVERRGMSYHDMGKLGAAARSAAISPITERILDGCIPEPMTGCWLWIGTVRVDSAGALRGSISINDRTVSAYRASYEAFRGPIPDGLELDHLCRLPICVNPQHLEAVTHKINQERGRGSRTHCKRGHPFDERNTYTATARNGLTARDCRACGAIRQRGYAAAK